MGRYEVAALALTAAAAATPLPAMAGPPFETDDPAPTPYRKLELALFADAGGRGAEFDGKAGLDVNYGVRPGVQLTATVPFGAGSGDGMGGRVNEIDLAAKYRFLSAPYSGWSMAIAPIVTVPVRAAPEGGGRRMALQLPLWVGKENGAWSFFGGGGITFNPEADRDTWYGGAVALRRFRHDFRLGMELTWRGADSFEGHDETGVGIGCIVPLTGTLELHAAGGPRFITDEAVKYHFYIALAATL